MDMKLIDNEKILILCSTGILTEVTTLGNIFKSVKNYELSFFIFW